MKPPRVVLQYAQAHKFGTEMEWGQKGGDRGGAAPRGRRGGVARRRPRHPNPFPAGIIYDMGPAPGQHQAGGGAQKGFIVLSEAAGSVR